MDGLMEVLTGETLEKYINSTTAVFKLIPFQNTAIDRAGIAELVTRQNDFLNRTMATSVVEVVVVDDIYNTEKEGEKCYDEKIREWAMAAKTKSNN